MTNGSPFFRDREVLYGQRLDGERSKCSFIDGGQRYFIEVGALKVASNGIFHKSRWAGIDRESTAPLAQAGAPPAHAASAPTPAAVPGVAPVCGPTGLSATSHPLGGKAVSGSATITQVGNTTDIRQSSTDVAIDWLRFSVGSEETVDFLQPSASAVAVNRIAGVRQSRRQVIVNGVAKQ